MSRTSDTWPGDRVSKLRVLWTQGLSATEIAKQLGVTRCAVLGKVHRLNLPLRAMATGGSDKHRSRRAKAAAERAASEVKALGRAVPPASLPIDRSRETGAARGDWNVRYADKSESHCLMFVGGESRDTGFICGRIRQFDKPYCSACSRIAYLPPEMKRRVA